MPRDEQLRQRIAARLQAGESYRTIRRAEKASHDLIAQVARESGLLRKGANQAPPADKATPAAPPGKEGNGLDEYQPGPEQSARSPAPTERSVDPRPSTRPSAPTEHPTEHSRPSAPTGGPSAPTEHPTERSAGAAPTDRAGGCPHCGQRWTLDPGEKAPSSCPICHQLLDVQAAAADERYGCGACGATWTLDAGDAMQRSCPHCGVAFQ